MSRRQELPLVLRRKDGRLRKTGTDGCTSGEALAEFEKPEELVDKCGIDPARFGGR